MVTNEALKQVLTVYNDASSVSMWLDTVFGQNIGNALNEGVVNMMAGQGSAQDIVKGVETAAAKRHDSASAPTVIPGPRRMLAQQQPRPNLFS